MPTAFGFRPYTNRNVLRSGYPVCVIATFNPAGNLRPVSFGAEFDGMRYRYRIKSSSVVRNTHDEFAFDCEYIDLGRVKTVRLVFMISRCQWVIG